MARLTFHGHACFELLTDTGSVLLLDPFLDDNPAAVNADPYGEGWMIKLRPSDPASVDGLLTAAQYEALIGG